MSADDMLLDTPTAPPQVRQWDVEHEPRTPEWLAYHRLVVDEARGAAPEGTAEQLAADPYKWAAHLGCAIPATSSRALRRYLTSRKGDVVALRKRDALEREVQAVNDRRTVLGAMVRQIGQAAEAGDLDRVRELAATAIILEASE